MAKRGQHRTDTNEIAFRVMRVATGEEMNPPPKNPRAVKRGQARAEVLTAQERQTIAKRAAAVRWGKKKG